MLERFFDCYCEEHWVDGRDYLDYPTRAGQGRIPPHHWCSLCDRHGLANELELAVSMAVARVHSGSPNKTF